MAAAYLVAGDIGVAFAEDDDDDATAGTVEELFRLEPAKLQASDEWQVTLAPTYGKGGEGKRFAVLTGVEYGLSGRWEASLEWDAFVHRESRETGRSRGIGDLEVGIKCGLTTPGHRPWQAVFAFDLGFPTGSAERGLGEGVYEYTPALLFGWSHPRWQPLTLYAQAGVSLVHGSGENDDGESPAHEYFLRAAGVYSAGRFAFSLEGSWNDNTWNHEGDEQAFYVVPGLHWLPGPGWQVGAGISIGVNRRADDYQIGLVLVREF